MLDDAGIQKAMLSQIMKLNKAMDLIFYEQENNLQALQNKVQTNINQQTKNKTLDSRQRNESQITEIVPLLDLSRVDPYFKAEENKAASNLDVLCFSD